MPSANMGNKEEDDLSKDFSDLLSRSSSIKRNRAERRSRVQNITNETEVALNANKQKSESVRNLAKRFEASTSTSKLVVESEETTSTATKTTTETTVVTSADTGFKSNPHTTSNGKPKPPPPQPKVKPQPQPPKVLMSNAAYSGTPTITEFLPPKRKSTNIGPADQSKLLFADNPKPSPHPSPKVLKAQAALSSGAPPVAEKTPPQRNSTVADRASLFAPANQPIESNPSPSTKIAGAPVPSEKMKRVQAAFSGPPPMTPIVHSKRTSLTTPSPTVRPAKADDPVSPPIITPIIPEKRVSIPLSPAKPAKEDTTQSFFKIAQAAFSGFAATPGLSSQNMPQKQTPPTAKKVAPSPVPSSKVKLAHEIFKQNQQPPIHTPASFVPPKRAPPASPGFFSWSNINALTQPASNNPTPASFYGFGRSPSLAIPPAVPQNAPMPPAQSLAQRPFPATASQQEVPPTLAVFPTRHQEANSILLSPEQQEAYKKKSSILKDPTATPSEKLRMYLTSVQQEAGEKKQTGQDEAANDPSGSNGNHEIDTRGISVSHQSSASPPAHFHLEINDDSQEDGASGSSDSSPTFTDMISKSIDKVVWNYSGSYSDNPRDSPPPAISTQPTSDIVTSKSIDKVVWNYGGSYSDNPRDSPPSGLTIDTPASAKASRFVDVEISKDGVDEFDLVEDDDDLFHDEYGVIAREKQRQKSVQFKMLLIACIGASLVGSFVLVGLGLVDFSWLSGDEDGIPSGPWTGDCFQNKLELRMAIDRFLQDTSKTSEIAQKYGWPINSWCVSELDDFSYLFRAKVGDVGGSPMRLSSFNEDISSWDVSNGRFFNQMFLGANFNGDLSKWNVGNAIDMERMFDESSFTGDLSSWNVKNVKNTKFMFRNAKNFNSDLSKWQLAPDSMEGMFLNAEAFSSDLHGFDVSNVRDFADVFSGASSFNGDISTWNMESAERLDGLFMNAELFNGDLSKWSVKPTSMDSTFYGTSSFTGRKGLPMWDTAKVDDMHRVFAYSKFQGDISSWNMSSVTTVREMFLGCLSFDGDVSKWDVSNVNDFSSMFEGAEAFSSDLSNWNVSSGTKFDRMFAGTSSFNKDLSMWNITSVHTMTDMFANATSYSKNLCSWGAQVLQSYKNPKDFDAAQWSLFEGTRCPETSSVTNFTATPPGPFCYPCSQ